MKFVTEHWLRVKAFMLKAKQNCPDTPVEELSKEVRILRAKLILEEALELITDGLGVTVEQFGDEVQFQDLDFYADKDFDIVKAADGCADLSVVNVGTLIACGLKDEPLLQLVDENNLAKFGPGHSIREDGKLIKPPGHKPPDFGTVIKRMSEM